MSAHPQHPAHIIRSDAEAIEVATRLAARFAVEASERDRERRLPVAELDEFSASGLWGITAPKAYGGAEVSYVTVAEVIDNWDGFGQRTTASGGVTLDGVTVPLSAVIPAHLAFDQPTADGPISQIIQAAVDTGIALGALEQTKLDARQARPWIDSQQDHGWQDPFTIAAIGDLEWRVHGTEAILAKAGKAVDQALAGPSEDSVAHASLVVAQAKVLSAETALLASSKLFELAGTRSVTGKHNLDRFWRNARTHTLHDPVRWKYHLIGNFVLNGVKPARHAWN